MNLAKWLYDGGRPNRAATIINRCWAAVYALGVAPNYLVTLEVTGRRSGRVISLPMVMAVVAGERYLVSMLGEEVEWVRNVRAAVGNVTLRHGRREEVRLEEVGADLRAPILKAYLNAHPARDRICRFTRMRRFPSSSRFRQSSPCFGSLAARNRVPVIEMKARSAKDGDRTATVWYRQVLLRTRSCSADMIAWSRL
jgi:hypothetical protein